MFFFFFAKVVWFSTSDRPRRLEGRSLRLGVVAFPWALGGAHGSTTAWWDLSSTKLGSSVVTSLQRGERCWEIRASGDRRAFVGWTARL